MTTQAPADEAWTIRKVITWATDDLKKRGGSAPRLEVELLLGRVVKLDRVGLLIDADRPLSRAELAAYRALHQRRRSGEPVAYLLGAREFYGRSFKVDQRVLIPRPDTETLIDVALERTRRLSLSARVLDLCTGSGCVAITLSRERPTTRVIGSDLSPDALTVAHENAIRLGAVTCGFVRSDLFAAFAGGARRFDLITANPPYIAEAEIPTLAVDIRKFEPRMALTGGDDGLVLVRRIIEEAPTFLDEDGVLAMEIGSGQAPEVVTILDAAGYREVAVRKDYGGHERVVSALRP